MIDELGDRMKKQYEDRTRYSLPRRTYTIIRLDGKAFHTLTRKMVKPFDNNLENSLIQAAYKLCNSAMGCRMAYLQSDEMSFLLTDFEKPETESWFDGNIQKICSVSSSIVTAGFNDGDYIRNCCVVQGYFDARVFTIPDPVEVENYFIWRQKDCMRNSVSMVAQHHFCHEELNGKSQSEMLKMLKETNYDWENYADRNKYGTLIQKEEYFANPTDKFTGNDVLRKRWVANAAPVFTQERMVLKNLIPVMDNGNRSNVNETD